MHKNKNNAHLNELYSGRCILINARCKCIELMIMLIMQDHPTNARGIGVHAFEEYWASWADTARYYV